MIHLRCIVFTNIHENRFPTWYSSRYVVYIWILGGAMNKSFVDPYLHITYNVSQCYKVKRYVQPNSGR